MSKPGTTTVEAGTVVVASQVAGSKHSPLSEQAPAACLGLQAEPSQ
jgi:hypothetical protein